MIAAGCLFVVYRDMRELIDLAHAAELPAVVFVPLWMIESLIDEPAWLANVIGEFIADLHSMFTRDD